MSSLSKPRFWLCAAAMAAAFWVTFRVLDADAAPMARPIEEVVTYGELPDPALDALIQRFAEQATAAQH
jgi:hypothetical protein